MKKESLNNLKKPWTTEEARINGQLGGSTFSNKKKVSCSINPLKHGAYAKDKTLQKYIQPKTQDKIMDVTREQKIAEIKRLNSFYGAQNAIKCFEGIEEDISLMQTLMMEVNTKDKDNQKLMLNSIERLIKLKLDVVNLRFGALELSQGIYAMDLSTFAARLHQERIDEAESVPDVANGN